LEDLSRSDAAREARELRERLATDGARLGKIVYTRAGMRSVETWEDGRASKQLMLRKTVLQEKRRTLEQRQTAAKRVIKQVEESKENQSDVSASSDHDETDLVGGIHVRTPLEAMEAFESVRFHLSNVRRQEKELVLEDQTLNDEKCAHIRALKRVASEDSSRFRSRPKVRYVGSLSSNVYGIKRLGNGCISTA
jgi:tousled-like kinase